MAIRLIMQPKTPPMTREEFCAATGPFSIGLDGFIRGPSWFDPKGPHANFNHHEGANGFDVHATCGQIMLAIRQGFFERFRDENGPRVDVYANDCDEDVCSAWASLNNHHLILSAMNPNFNRLNAMEDVLDATAGTYPFPKDLPALRELAWVFEPYRQFRLSGELDKKDADSFVSIVTSVEHRILQFVLGKGLEIPLDTRYERIGGGKGWAMIRETGAQGRMGAIADGIRAYVSVRERLDGRWTYTIGRMSVFIPFDLPPIIKMLNTAEGLTDSKDRWGGSDIVGGSPRVAGSKLSPQEVEHIINNEVLAKAGV